MPYFSLFLRLLYHILWGFFNFFFFVLLILLLWNWLKKFIFIFMLLMDFTCWVNTVNYNFILNQIALYHLNLWIFLIKIFIACISIKNDYLKMFGQIFQSIYWPNSYPHTIQITLIWLVSHHITRYSILWIIFLLLDLLQVLLWHYMILFCRETIIFEKVSNNSLKVYY